MISIIVPIYNSSKYLKECIDSIINQDYTNFELLLIDDGSTDNSLEICKYYKDKRIKIIQTKHQGVSNARNIGLDKSKGEFICFIDSDDIIEKDYLSQMLKYMTKDISYVECNFDYFTDDISQNKQKNKKINIFDNKEMLYRLYSKEGLRTSIIVNKLYRKKIFKKLRFEDKLNEDEYIIHKIINNSNKIVTLENKLYHYRIHKNSRQRTINKEKINIIHVFEEREKLLDDKKFQELNYIAELNQIIYLYCVFYKYSQYNETKKLYKLFFKKYNTKYEVNLTKKIKYRLFIKNPDLFAKITLIKKQYKYI